MEQMDRLDGWPVTSNQRLLYILHEEEAAAEIPKEGERIRGRNDSFVVTYYEISLQLSSRSNRKHVACTPSIVPRPLSSNPLFHVGEGFRRRCRNCRYTNTHLFGNLLQRRRWRWMVLAPELTHSLTQPSIQVVKINRAEVITTKVN